MTGILNALIAGVSGAVKDTYFNLVSLLLPGNGTNGATNNSFVDSSTANSGTGWPITPNGDVTQGTFSPFSQTGWGNYFDGSNDYLSLSSNAAFDFGTGDFTIEAWVYTDGTTESFGKRVLNKFVSNGWLLEVLRTSGNTVRFLWINSSNTTVADIGTNDTLSPFVWHHIAVSRSGANISLYVDGTRKATSSSVSGGTDNVSNNLLIGSANLSDTYFDGYISNSRIVKGTAVYDPTLTTLTVPTAPLTAITNTSLLTCQSNRFVDNSSSPKTITANNGVAITPFSPFAPTSSYSAAAVGGSGYFDGSGDYLSAADNAAFDFGSGDFTVEMWTYLTGTSSAAAYRMTGQCSSAVFDSDLSFAMMKEDATDKYLAYVRSGSTNYETRSSQTATRNAWVHIALVRSGGNLNQYINGQLDGQSTTLSTNALNNSTKELAIGRQGEFTAGNYLGYIANYRIVKGTAVYTGNFTPPTGQLATSGAASAAAYSSTTNVNTSFSSSACSLLLNFTNAGVVDATAKNVLETEGNAQISTAQSKWGGGSISVSSGNYLTAPSNVLLPFGTGDFTIEFWAYWNGGAFSTYATAIDTRNGSFAGGLAIAANITTGAWYISIAAQEILSTTAAAASWQHVAVTRQGTSLKLFVNGTQAGSTYTSSDNFSNTTLRVGVRPDNQYPWNGYLDDIRITRGLARYTSNFTAPTAPFPVQ
jgi:hypothetical protein